MGNALTPKKLAEKLAQAARILHEDGNINAQAVIYGLLLKRWMLDACVDSLVDGIGDLQVLDQVDLHEVFSDYLRQGKDPAVYFYEDFIRAFDPANARKRGVHYSPPQVVSYMARCIDRILKTQFGLSIPDAIILDPSCGTGTFLKHIKDSYKPIKGRMIGLELMETPAAVAKCILSGCDIRQIDSLGDIDLDTENQPLVIIGNPPYSGHSSNAGKLETLLADYKTGLNERNPKWLQDDYVKFIRMAQHRVESAGRGIVAFITNHSFLFNPTFRVMRESLMRSFDRIHILDLNGNAKINQHSGPDENVFPIQMGVAISFMVRTSDSAECKVSHARVVGTRQEKLDKLSGLNFADTPWVDVVPAKPFSLFTPVDHKLRDEYYSFPSLFDLFDKSSVGFVTSRDAFAVDTDRDALLQRIADLRDDKISPDEIKDRYRVGDLDLEATKRILRDDPKWQDRAVEVAYRPFDRRWAFLSQAVMERPRLPFMENMLRDNIALAVGRAGQVTGSGEWDVIFCTDCPTDLNLFRRGGAMLFPKYVYVSGRRFPNLQPGAPNRKQIFEYIYAVLHSATYRQRYADFLATDYPRVPIVPDAQIFESLYALGKELISLHLTRETPPDSESVQLKIGGYTITKHAAQTLAIRNKIDEIIAATPPWQTAQDHSMPPGRDKANAAHNVIPSEARNLLCTNIPKADSSLHSE